MPFRSGVTLRARHKERPLGWPTHRCRRRDYSCDRAPLAWFRVQPGWSSSMPPSCRKRAGRPARECVADRFGNRAAACYKRRLLFEHEPHRLHDGLERLRRVANRLSANVGFNGIEFGDLAQRFVAIGALVACATRRIGHAGCPTGDLKATKDCTACFFRGFSMTRFAAVS